MVANEHVKIFNDVNKMQTYQMPKVHVKIIMKGIKGTAGKRNRSR
jgi:hypothetical protein